MSFQLPNWIEFLVLHFAATRIGAVSNPLIPIYRDREVGFMVGFAESKVLVVPREFRKFDYPAMVDRLRPTWPALQHVFVVDGQPGDANPSWESFMDTPWEQRRDPAELTTVRPDPNEVTLLMFTSGTTGEPKGVMHTHNSLVAAIAPLPERLGVNSDSVIHMASTVAHLTGLLYGVRLQTQIGATGVYQDVWSNERFVELIEQHRITLTSAATPFLHDTLNAPNIDAHDVSSLVRFCCFGAPIPPAIVRQARQRWPELAVISGWGQTEDALVTLGIPGDSEEKVVDRAGYPLPGMQIRVVDEAGTVLPADTDGRLQVTGPFLFAGYAKRLEMTRELFDGKWFDTGDIARIDPDGYLKISGRTKDVIIRGGENIPVAYVENALYENPKIASVAVDRHPGPPAAGTGLRLRRAQARGRGVHLRRDAAVPGREGPGPAVLAGTAGGAGRVAVHGERQDPEIPAPRSDHGCVMTGSTGNQAFLVAGVRTPFGRYGGALATVRPDDLAAHVLRELSGRLPSVDWDELDDVLLGCANQAGEDNRNVARMATLLAGLPVSAPGGTVNRLCGSSLDAIAIASRAVRSGDADLVLAGGVESMSRAPFVIPKATSAFSRSTEIHDTTIGWRFVNPAMREQFGTDSMPETADNVAAGVRHRPGGPGRVRPALAGTDRQGHRLGPAGQGDRAGDHPAAAGRAGGRRHRRAPAGDLAGGAGQAEADQPGRHRHRRHRVRRQRRRGRRADRL